MWKNKEKKKSNAPLLPDDLSEVLDCASEEELMELAGKYAHSFLSPLLNPPPPIFPIITLKMYILYYYVKGLPT